MVGRGTWRKNATFVLATSACATLIFFSFADRPRAAGNLLQRVTRNMREGFQVLTQAATPGTTPVKTDPARLRGRGAVLRGKSPAAVAREADAKRRDNGLVRLRGYEFDPQKGNALPPTLAELVAPRQEVVPGEAAAAAHARNEYWIVQAEEDELALREHLESVKVEVLAWVPNTAWLVRLEPGQISQVRALPNVRWAGPYVAAYKVMADAVELAQSGDTTAMTLDERGRVRLFVHLHRGVDVESYVPAVKALAGVELLETLPNERLIRVTVTPDALKEALVSLAFLKDVAVVEVERIPTALNDNAVWKIQTGFDSLDYFASARLFALGIAGQGMIGAYADSGNENDVCQMRYTNTLADTAYVTGPDDNLPVPPEGGTIGSTTPPPVRTRDRKIVAYYVMDNATAYDEIRPANPPVDDGSHLHGTVVSGTMAGDANTVLAGRPLLRNTGSRQNVAPYTTTSAWTFGMSLRDDLIPKVDNPTLAEPQFPPDFGGRVQHHQRRDGMAPAAQLVVQDIGNAAGLGGIFTPQGLLIQANDTGATVFNASFGGGPCDPNTCYNGPAQSADRGIWMRRDLVGFAAVGNDGDLGIASSVGSGFNQAVNMIGVGAMEAGNSSSDPPATRRGEDVALYSSKGPKAGGLLSPEIMAPGTVFSAFDLVADAENGTGSGNGGCGPPEAQVEAMQGTSFSSPAAAGAGLLVQQYFLDGWYPTGEKTPANGFRPTNALVRAILVNSTRNLTGGRTDDLGSGPGDRPNFGQGWGAVTLDDTLYFSGDPLLGRDPQGDLQRARLGVLNDAPNGWRGAPLTLSTEPGGKLRSELIPTLTTSIRTNGLHEFFVTITKTDFDGDTTTDDPANELRFTMAYMSQAGDTTGGFPLQNDLDMEVISPSGVIYRPSPVSGVWTSGYTQPATEQTPQSAAPFTDFQDRDRLNPVENVFIAAPDVEAGPWRVRVIGYSVRGGDGTNNGRPNFYDGDRTRVDLGSDGVVDGELEDVVNGIDQGYALVLTGNFTTDQGSLSLSRSNFDCSGQELVVTLNDRNGASPRQACDPGTGPLDPDMTVTIVATTPSLAFPADVEVVVMDDGGDGPPTYTSPSLPVIVTQDPDRVINGNGILEVFPNETIVATYVDAAPCGAESFAQANVGCTPSVEDSGFRIEDGCDRAVPGDVSTPLRPDQFLDADELNRYTVFFLNNGAEDLTDALVSLTPDPTDRVSPFVTVLDSPKVVGLAPPGRRSDATFLVKMGAAGPVGSGIPPRYSLDFIVGVSSPRDNLLFADTFIQTQILESDIESYRYNTRDPGGRLWGMNKVEQLVPGATEGSTNSADYITHSPMWFNPDADCGAAAGIQPCSGICNVHPTLAPPECFSAAARTDNPDNPWDFDDTDENFQPAAHDGDPLIGPGAANGLEEWFWKTSPTGGGCGWEDELHRQLTGLPAGDPDRFAQPWGIWHTGAINRTVNGVFPGPWPDNEGVPFHDVDDTDPLFHTIMRDYTAEAGVAANNTNGQWCNTYLSRTDQGDFYRTFLIPPTLHKVHASSPDFKVAFQELRFYSRLDGHTVDENNLSAAVWLVHNQPVAPINPGPPAQYSWGQYQYGTAIYSDGVREEWAVDENFLDINLAQPNEDFPDLTYEDIYGPAAESWDFAFGWANIHEDGIPSKGQYGFGIDDVQFIWTESREVDDRSTCGVPSAQAATVFFSTTRYNACDGDLEITVIDCDQPLDEIAVAVTSAAEDFEIAYLERVNDASIPGCGYKFVGKLPYTSDATQDAVGVIIVSPGSIDIGSGADTVTVEYDPREADPDLGHTNPQEVADWEDVNPANGINDDDDGDGTPNAEDDVAGVFERGDTSVINCTSGRIYYIKHVLRQEGAGDNDRFADHGEKQFMSVELLSQLGIDLQDVTVTISTDDPTVCIVIDQVQLDELKTGVRTSTPIGGLLAPPGRQGLYFSVPLAVRTTSLANPATVTFRVDVEGVNTSNLNAFSTRGLGFNSFLPQEAQLLLDVDDLRTTPNFNDVQGGLTGRAPGEWREGFENPDATAGYDHYWIPGVAPGPQVVALDALTDERFGVNLNEGFCPECDVQTECRVPEDCEYNFTPAEYPNPPEWNFTTSWAKEIPAQYGTLGRRAMMFGRQGATDQDLDQHYAAGQFATFELPPLRIANDFPLGVAPQLRFWHIADFWVPNYTNGLVTPIGAGVLEINASAVGMARNDRYTGNAVHALYQTKDFRRIYPFENSYDTETDALNACQTFWCRFKHPVFAENGSFLTSPTGTDPRAGATVGTWEEVAVDLSDYRGREVVIRFTVAVPSDFDIQNGNFGWVIDDIRMLGLAADGASARGMGIALETDNSITTDPCGLTAEFRSTSADCAGQVVQLFDDHSGLGTFNTTVTPAEPYPIRYEWRIGSLTIGPGDAGAPILGITGVRGTYDNPQVDLAEALGVGPSITSATMILTQNGVEVGRVTHSLVYKDAPVPVINVTSSGPFIDGTTQFSAAGTTFDQGLDASRSLQYVWDFGDGSPPETSGEDVSHAFTAAGTYTVTVTVTDEDGCAGIATRVVNVVAGPQFTSPTAAFDRACATPGGQGSADTNGDLNEFIQMLVGFTNSGGLARGVTGYLSSIDPAVEITRGVAFYGDVPTGPSQTRPYTFIRRPVPGESTSCIVVPFRLTLVSDGGTIVDEVEFGFALGGATQVAHNPLALATDSGVMGEETDPPFRINPAVSGCLDSMSFRMVLSSTGLATMGFMSVELVTPEFESYFLKLADGSGGTTRTWTVDFYFGPDPDAPINASGGVVVDSAGTLPAALRDSLISNLTGDAIGGQWQVIVRDNHVLRDPAGTWTARLERFALEGTSPLNLDTGIEPSCTQYQTCFPGGTPPVFQGARAECLGTGILLWRAAEDTSTCGGGEDVSYQLYGSTTEGAIGSPATMLDPDTQTCADCPPGAACAFDYVPGASFWEVCDVGATFWTVVAVDGTTAATTPALPASAADMLIYQTNSRNCAVPPLAPLFTFVKTTVAGVDRLNLWLTNPYPANTAFDCLKPGENAVGHRLLRGTFPQVGTLGMLGSRALPYDHQVINCQFAPITQDVSPELSVSGSYYYLVGAVNAAGCVGIGNQGTPNGSGGLDFVTPRPPGVDNCVPAGCSAGSPPSCP